MPEKETRNSKMLRSFVQYCEEHPKERFWQALRNWSGQDYVFAGKVEDDASVSSTDTFYWEENK